MKWTTSSSTYPVGDILKVEGKICSLYNKNTYYIALQFLAHFYLVCLYEKAHTDIPNQVNKPYQLLMHRYAGFGREFSSAIVPNIVLCCVSYISD